MQVVVKFHSVAQLNAWRVSLFIYDEFMKKAPETIVEAILAGDSSLDGIRAAFRNLEGNVFKSQRETVAKREKFEKDYKDGARATKHRFNP